MRTHIPSLAMIALVGFCSQANAQGQCQELARLRSEAAEALRKMPGVPTSDRCAAYVRYSMAWGTIVQHANEHREACDISIVSLSSLEKYRREAVTARKNVCAGRPVRHQTSFNVETQQYAGEHLGSPASQPLTGPWASPMVGARATFPA